jgi:DNA-directed RNA polymerase subunit L
MEIKVVSEDEKKLVLEIPNESVGFTNLLRTELWNDSSISEAANIKEHPYLSQPKVFLKVSRGSPRTALEKAATRIADQAKDFKENFCRALKK